MTLFKKPDSGLDRMCSTHGKVVVGVGPEGWIFATLRRDQLAVSLTTHRPTRHSHPCRYISETGHSC